MAQTITMVAMIGCGCLIGAGYDFYRISLRRRDWGQYAWPWVDWAYGLIAAIFAFQLLLLVNSGELRGYVWLSLGIGLLIYFWKIHLIFRPSVVFLNYVFEHAFSIVWKVLHVLLVMPITFALGIAYKFISMCSRMIWRPLRWVVKSMNSRCRRWRHGLQKSDQEKIAE